MARALLYRLVVEIAEEQMDVLARALGRLRAAKNAHFYFRHFRRHTKLTQPAILSSCICGVMQSCFAARLIVTQAMSSAISTFTVCSSAKSERCFGCAKLMEISQHVVGAMSLREGGKK